MLNDIRHDCKPTQSSILLYLNKQPQGSDLDLHQLILIS